MLAILPSRHRWHSGIDRGGMVPGAGLEPARCRHRGILSPLRLPIPPPGQTVSNNHKLEAEPGIEPRSTALQAAA